jgi:hypothetical protein
VANSKKILSAETRQKAGRSGARNQRADRDGDKDRLTEGLRTVAQSVEAGGLATAYFVPSPPRERSIRASRGVVMTRSTA